MSGQSFRPNSLLLMVTVALLPLLGAGWLYVSGQGIPTGRVNQGQLVSPLMSVADLGEGAHELVRKEQQAWRMLLLADQECRETCDHLLDDLKRVQLALGRYQSKVAVNQISLAADAGKEPRSARFDAWLAQHGLSSAVIVADPWGNLVLAYGMEEQTPRQLLQDMKRLLRASGGG